jgi:hypothetical protein
MRQMTMTLSTAGIASMMDLQTATAAVRSVFDGLRTRSRWLVIDRWDPLIVLTRISKANDRVCETQEEESQHQVNETIDQQGRSSSEPHHGPSCSIKSPSILTTLILDD